MKLKLRQRSKVGAIFVLDVAVAIIILNAIAAFFYGAIIMSSKSTIKATLDFHQEHLLSECAEVVQSFRYWEWDRTLWETGWTNYQSKYPTGMYSLEYHEPTRSWKANPIVDTHWVIVQNPEAAEQLGLFWQFEKIMTKTQTDDWNLSDIWPDDYSLRAVYIDNSLLSQSMVSCYVKVNKLQEWEDTFKNFGKMNFVMMNYL